MRKLRGTHTHVLNSCVDVIVPVSIFDVCAYVCAVSRVSIAGSLVRNSKGKRVHFDRLFDIIRDIFN